MSLRRSNQTRSEQHPAMIRAVTNLKAAGKTTFLCLSSSNTVFISTILEVCSIFSTTTALPLYAGQKINRLIPRDRHQPSRMGAIGPPQSPAKNRSQWSTALVQIRVQPEHVQRYTDAVMISMSLMHITGGRRRTGGLPREAQRTVRSHGIHWRWVERLLPRTAPQKVVPPYFFYRAASTNTRHLDKILSSAETSEDYPSG